MPAACAGLDPHGVLADQCRAKIRGESLGAIGGGVRVMKLEPVAAGAELKFVVIGVALGLQEEFEHVAEFPEELLVGSGGGGYVIVRERGTDEERIAGDGKADGAGAERRLKRGQPSLTEGKGEGGEIGVVEK